MNFYHPKFKKKYKKLDLKIREKVNTAIKIFDNNSFDSRLRNHLLHGKYDGCRSIDVTGDIRIIYKQESNNSIFMEVGTHSELY